MTNGAGFTMMVLRAVVTFIHVPPLSPFILHSLTKVNSVKSKLGHFLFLFIKPSGGLDWYKPLSDLI